MKNILIDNISQLSDGQVNINIAIDGNNETVEMNFSENVRDYISTDRADAIIMGLLMFAIKRRVDIQSNLPISETLYYKLTHHFIPGICNNGIYRPKILTNLVKDVKRSDNGIVATGISCGVDSLYSIKEHTEDVSEEFKLNHLLFLDAGAHHFGSPEKWDELYKGRLQNARNFSKEVGLPLIEINTNLPLIIEKYTEYSHLEHHTYMMLSCLLMIQKNIRKYYYSGGYPYNKFDCNILPDKVAKCAKYDLFILWAASNSETEFCSTGGSLNRYEKVIALGNYKPSWKYLNVCVASVQNCGKCFKCKRTLLEIDAAGNIDKYGSAFDIKTYKREREKLIKEGLRNAIKGDETLAEITDFFNHEISPMQRRIQSVRVGCGKIVSKFR